MLNCNLFVKIEIFIYERLSEIMCLNCALFTFWVWQFLKDFEIIIMTLKIFADLLSQPSRALVLFCRAAKVPHEFQAVNLKSNSHKSKAMTKINPLQTVRQFRSLTPEILQFRIRQLRSGHFYCLDNWEVRTG